MLFPLYGPCVLGILLIINNVLLYIYIYIYIMCLLTLLLVLPLCCKFCSDCLPTFYVCIIEIFFHGILGFFHLDV